MILLFAIQSKLPSFIFYVSKLLVQKLFINDIFHGFVFTSYSNWKIYILAWKKRYIYIKVIA